MTDYAGHRLAVACPLDTRGAQLHVADANGPSINAEVRDVGAPAGRVGATAADQLAPLSSRHECGEVACPARGTQAARLALEAVVGESRPDCRCVYAATCDPASGFNSPVGHVALVGRSGGVDSGGAPPLAQVNRGLTDAGDTPGDAEASTPFGSLDARRCVPVPVVRKLRMHMDSCPSTNKSQFFYGGIGLMLASGLLDCAMVVYMVVGHTKFGPDLVARQISGRYNTEEAFNHRQLVNIIRPYATAGAYDDTLLQTWKRHAGSLHADWTYHVVEVLLAARRR